MVKYNIRKMTFEDRFARHYYGQHARMNSVRNDKRKNGRIFRQLLKKEMDRELEDL